MKRRTADVVVGSAIALVVIVGLIGTWQALQTSQRASSGMMMNGMMTSSMYTGPSPIWILFGTVAVVAIIGVGYVVVREERTSQTTPRFERSPAAAHTPTEGAMSDAENVAGTTTGTATTAGPEDDADSESTTEGQDTTEPTGTSSRPSILDVLPEDERRILEPVIESPGLTQIALRDRADFSKSKVSQTVSDLEKRGLLDRERQGRTYRIYPTDELTDQE
ncbi:MAG: helix-turn-helix transcriptional regulator [Halobacteriota archaeon]